MKKLSILIILFLFGFTVQKSLAQSTLWGMTSAGGFSNGVVFGMNTGSTAISTQTALTNNAGSSPQFVKLLEVGGKLYGVTNTGGISGMLFEYNPTTNIYVPKFSFTGTSGSYPGANPQGPLLLTSGGKIYGMTRSGGSNNGGVIFEYAPSTNGYTVLTNLQAGSLPSGGLIETSSGRFVGLCRGPSNGILFEFLPGSNTTSTLVAFTNNGGSFDGNAPNGSLLESSSNILYGLTQSGGANSDGVLFKYNLSTSGYSVITTFTSASTGKTPLGSLMKATNGKLYGVASMGGTSNFGTLFELDPSTDTFTKLVDFAGTSNGNSPQCTLLEISGKLYGTTRFGGTNNGGVIFEYNISGATLTKKIDMAVGSGNVTVGSLMLASNGKVYGTTTGGGTGSQGVIFEYDVTNNIYTKKIDLNTSQGGGFYGSLTLGTNSKFYAMCGSGGTANQGGIFEYDYANNTYALKTSFPLVNGSTPYGSLVLAGNGKFYGLTSAGGSNGFGTLIEYVQAATSITKKVDFTGTSGAAIGSKPLATMIEAGGKLYGTTYTGGANDLGTIFEYDYTNNIYTKKIDLNGSLAPTGSGPQGLLALASNSMIYGVCENGGSNGVGVLYEYDYINNSYTTKINFNGSSLGATPIGGLIVATNGLIYGTTSEGGTNSVGVLFSYNPSNNTLTKLVDFSSTSGHTPLGALRQAANGKLYGMTSAGGANSVGTVFEYDITNSIFTKLLDFNQTNGAVPRNTQFAEICTKPTTAGAISAATSVFCAGNASAATFSIATIGNATSYSWTPPSGGAITSGSTSNAPTFSLSGLASGTYTMDARGVNVCGTGTAAAISITVNPNATIAATGGTICSGQSFTISPTGASTYTYSSGSAVVSPTTTTNYSVTGTNSFGCPAITPAVVGVTVGAQPTIGVNSGTICAGQSFTLNGTGAASYTYSSGQVVTPANTTTYGVTGTSTNGCVSSATAVASVTVYALPVISVSSGSICSGSSYTMVPSGAQTYTYSSGTAIVSPTSSTQYSVTGTSSLGCVSAAAAVSSVTVNLRPTIVVNSGTICNGQSYTITPTGANTYTISGGAFVVNPSTNATYTVTGTSAEGCPSTNSAVASVGVNTVPIISVNSGTICNGASFVMNPSGASSYTFSSGSPTVSPSSSSTYSVIGTSPAGCVSTASAVSNVTVYALPVISVNSGSICEASSFTMTPSGASSYTYSSGSSVVSPTLTTSYSVTGTSSLGCVSSAPAIANVTVIARPVVSASNGTICNGQSFTVVPSGASTYTITGGAFVVSPSTNATYSITGTSAVGCLSSNTAVASVVVNTVPVIAVNSGTICNGNSFVMSPTGAASYTFSSGSATVSPSSTTAYTVSGTSAAGCSSTLNAISTVTVYAIPFISVNSGSICSGQSFTMTPSGASTYTYSSGSAIVSPTTTTSYSVVGTSTAGCVSTAPGVANLTVATTPVVSASSGTICNGQSYTITPSGASSYTITGGTFVVSPGSTTSYSITGASAVGCISSNTAVANVTVFALPVISASSGTICNGQSFFLNPGGASTYTYSGGSATVSPSSTTQYSITGTSTAGCISAAPAIANVTVYAIPVISVNSGSICNGQSFTLVPSGASTYTYSSGSAIVSPGSTTAYSVTGTSTAGCISSAPAIANVTVVALPVVTASSGTICNGQTFNIVPGGASTYTITGGSFAVSPSSTTSYSITGTSAVGCIGGNTAVSTITVFALPVITANSGTICNGSSFVITPGGANTYTITGGTATVSPSSSTQYSITGTSTAGCISAGPAVSSVTVFALPVISVNSGSICNGQSFTMTPGGANTYTYSSGSAIVSPVTTTAYSVTGTSTAGCVSAAPAISNVTVIALPVVSASSGTICNGQTFNIVPNGAATYTITGGSFAVSPGSTTSYSVTGTSAVGCISSNTAISTVTVYALPVITANSGTICDGNSFVITPGGANTYTITGGTATVSPNTTTSYSITGTSTAGCLSAGPAVSTVTVYARPVISVNSGSICFGKSFTLTPGGAATYTITGGNAIVSPTVTSSYTVSGTSTAGCTSTTSAVANVTVVALPVVAINSGTICAGGTITLTPSGAATYTITGGNYVVSPAFTTSYSLTGTSSVGCVSSNTAVSTVTVYALPILSVNSGTICNGFSFVMVPNGASTYTFSSGSATVSPNVTTSYSVMGTSTAGCLSAGPAISTVTVYALPQLTVNSGTVCAGSFYTIAPSGALSYTISGGTALVNPSVTTSYTVLGSNVNGCISNPASIVTVSVIPLGTLTAQSGTICLGDVFTPTVTGGVTYTYSSGTSTMSPNVTTGYSVTGTDPNGCVTPPAAFIVVVNPLPNLSTSGLNTICIGQTASITPLGAVGYTWSAGTGTDLVVSPTVNTTYTVTGQGANGCFNTFTVPITVNMLPTVSVAGGAICPGNSFTFAPTGAVSYTYSNAGPIVTPSATAIYTIIGSSPDGCVSVPVTATVDVVNTLTVTVSGNKPICSGSSYVLIANGGATYTWNTGSNTYTTAVINGSLTGNSTFTVIAASGSCSDTSLVNITVNPLPPVTVNGPTIACIGEPVTLVVSGASTYTWTTPKSNSTSISVTQSATSVYVVKGTDSNGCVATISYTLESQDCTNLNENGATAVLNLYPNPSNGLFNIQSDSQVHFKIYDLKGQLISEGRVEQGVHEINLQPYAKGIYSVILSTDNKVKTYRVISQ